MADVFGDLSLFSEFEKDRGTQGSFIRYDEDASKSRIIFEDLEQEEESDTDDEWSGRDEASSNELGEESGKIKIESDSKEKGDDDSIDETRDRKTFESNGASSALSGSKEMKLSAEDEAKSAWLNEQLYADAVEEAKKSNVNLHQLIFERNKYYRYAKILDSTRYVPDEESPAVQLIFNNNSFARKYRQQIEQFIKGLLWEEFHSANQDSVSEITVKPGAPTCTDINKDLPPEKRSEHMRQKHSLIGNSQFHKQFLIDFLGWPFNVAEPTRCNVNWEIPLYGQVFNEVYADPTTAKTKKSGPGNKKQKPACWNCGEENHAVNECKQARNPAKIAANRREFLAQQQNSEPKFTGPSRYHKDPELASKFARFKPGVISENLREALGLQSDQMPQHIYKMRLFGYPPGWLLEAKQIQSGVSIFDKNGRATLITGECLEDGELNDESSEKTEYDVNKIIEYPGFTVPVPLGFVDESAHFKMPPIQQHQLKKTLMTQSSNKSSAKKRKRDKEAVKDGSKKIKTDEAGKEEGELGEEEDEEDSNMADETTEANTQELESDSTSRNSPTIKTTLYKSSSTISLSKDFGTPVLVRENTKLPDASKFGQGIEDHIPFENLPNSTGTFEKMRDLIDIIRKRAKN